MFALHGYANAKKYSITIHKHVSQPHKLRQLLHCCVPYEYSNNIEHAHDKQTQVTCVVMKSFCYSHAALQHFSHSSHGKSHRQGGLRVITD